MVPTSSPPPVRPRLSRIAVLASGSGSNLQALLDHLDAQAGAAERVTLVASDKADAGALGRAAARGIRTAVIDAGSAADAQSLAALLDPAAVDLVVLAGYLRLVPADVVARFRGRMLNVHPALLPAFGGPGMYGARVHRAVLDSGACISGPTVHFVDEHYDRGPIVAQWPVPVHRHDSVESLAARVLRAEHLLLPRVVRAVAAGQLFLGEDDRVHDAGDGSPHAPPPEHFALTRASPSPLEKSIELLLEH